MSDIMSLTTCPKCGLEAKTLLHGFCQHPVCPVREAIKKPKRASHTSGLWQQKHGEDLDGAIRIVTNVDADIDYAGTTYTYDAIAICHDDFEETLPNAEANAARIVACVNACDGIDNAALDAGVITNLVKAARGLLLWHQTGGQSGDYTLHEKALSSALAKLGQTP